MQQTGFNGDALARLSHHFDKRLALETDSCPEVAVSLEFVSAVRIIDDSTPHRKANSASYFPPTAYARSATHQPSLNVSSGSFPPAIGRSRGAVFDSCALIGGAHRQSTPIPSGAPLVGSPRSSFSRRWVGAAVLASHVHPKFLFCI